MTEADGRITAKDFINIGKLEITSHALGRFQMRTGLPIVDAAAQIRERFAFAIKLDKPPKVKLRRKKGVLFYQDQMDPNLIYVVEQKTGTHYVLKTTLRPLREPKVKR